MQRRGFPRAAGNGLRLEAETDRSRRETQSGMSEKRPGMDDSDFVRRYPRSAKNLSHSSLWVCMNPVKDLPPWSAGLFS
jgi:hypothetical protein